MIRYQAGAKSFIEQKLRVREKFPWSFNSNLFRRKFRKFERKNFIFPQNFFSTSSYSQTFPNKTKFMFIFVFFHLNLKEINLSLNNTLDVSDALENKGRSSRQIKQTATLEAFIVGKRNG